MTTDKQLYNRGLGGADAVRSSRDRRGSLLEGRDVNATAIVSADSPSAPLFGHLEFSA